MSAKEVPVPDAVRRAHPPTVSVRRQDANTVIVHCGLSEQAVILSQREASSLTLSLLSFSRGQVAPKERHFTVTRSVGDAINVQRTDTDRVFRIKQVELDALIEVLPLFA